MSYSFGVKRRKYVQQPGFRATLFGLPKRVGTTRDDPQSVLYWKQCSIKGNGEFYKRDSQTDSRGRCNRQANRRREISATCTRDKSLTGVLESDSVRPLPEESNDRK